MSIFSFLFHKIQQSPTPNQLLLSSITSLLEEFGSGSGIQPDSREHINMIVFSSSQLFFPFLSFLPFIFFFFILAISQPVFPQLLYQGLTIIDQLNSLLRLLLDLFPEGRVHPIRVIDTSSLYISNKFSLYISRLDPGHPFLRGHLLGLAVIKPLHGFFELPAHEGVMRVLLQELRPLFSGVVLDHLVGKFLPVADLQFAG